jgi:hypothetical protein
MKLPLSISQRTSWKIEPILKKGIYPDNRIDILQVALYDFL